MEDSIQILGGLKEAMPVLPERAPGWCKDSEELYIGTTGGNKKIADTAIFGKVAELEKRQGAAVADLPAGADAAAIIAGYNGLLNTLRSAGIIRTE